VIDHNPSNGRQDFSAMSRLDHDIATLKELWTAKAEAQEARFAAMDKAVMLLEKFPTAIDVAVGNLKELHQEKFEGVGTRLTELNTRLTQADTYKQVALDAALKAAQTLVDIQQQNNKEALKKTDDLFTKQMDGVKETVDDLKNVVRTQQGHGRGIYDGWGFLVGGIGMIVGVVAVIELLLRH
jgi:hypothetical protein